MNAAVVHKLGDPPQCEEFPEPVAGNGEVIVQVLAASLKPVDKQMAGGSHYASPGKVPLSVVSMGLDASVTGNEYSLEDAGHLTERWRNTQSYRRHSFFLFLPALVTSLPLPSSTLVSR